MESYTQGFFVPILNLGVRTRHLSSLFGTAVYFSKLSKRRPKPVKRPRHWAVDQERLILFSQLCCIAAEVPRTLVDCSRGILMGTVGWPDPDTMQFSFAPMEQDIEPPFPNEEIHFIAENKYLRYEFTTTIIGIDTVGRWILHCPDHISNEDRRTTPRFRLRGWKVILRRQGTMGEDVKGRVFDLSVSGLSIIVPRDDYRLRPEQPLVGLLIDNQGERLPLRAAIRHVAPWEQSETPRLFIGSCFDGFGVVNHARLSRLLASRQKQTHNGSS